LAIVHDDVLDRFGVDTTETGRGLSLALRRSVTIFFPEAWRSLGREAPGEYGFSIDLLGAAAPTKQPSERIA